MNTQTASGNSHDENLLICFKKCYYQMIGEEKTESSVKVVTTILLTWFPRYYPAFNYLGLPLVSYKLKVIANQKERLSASKVQK